MNLLQSVVFNTSFKEGFYLISLISSLVVLNLLMVSDKDEKKNVWKGVSIIIVIGVLFYYFVLSEEARYFDL